MRRRGKGHVGKGKEEASVNDPDAVQMPFFDSDDRGRRAVRGFHELDAAGLGKDIAGEVALQKFEICA